MIKAHQVSYSHKKYHILKGINVSIEYGELIAIVGPNGAGKSTLLNVLANELKTKDAERIFFKEKKFSEWNLDDLAKNKAKFSQHNPTDIPLLVKDVVIMGRYPFFEVSPKKEDLDAAENAMKKTDVFHMKNRAYNSLSGGEKQRVHLSRVLAQLENKIAHKLLFLDEPLNNLDIKHQHKILQTIKSFTQKTNTTIIVIHDLNLAAQFANKVVLMDKGKIVSQGEPSEVFTEDIITKTYGFPCKICDNPITKKPMIIFG
ncbi:MAG: heme ABC transporter ATP-binding protein [Mesonia hippocampi]|uniref:heme ABC transporter ATP-binding protein n=1 Tax=Mesonia hippocampi TaxID=1628250 RepID=UPI003F9BB702